jgi:PAS domain-containing protein
MNESSLTPVQAVTDGLVRPVQRYSSPERARGDSTVGRSNVGIRTDDARPADPLEGLLAALGPRELRADLARAIHALRLRVKELTALHGAAELLQDDARSEEETLTQIALLLPSALQFPAIAVGRVTLGDSSFATPDWKDTPWNLRASFHTDDGQEGAVEAAYVRAAPPSAEVPFLAEERKLLDSLARMIAAAIGRRRALEQIRYLVAGGRVRMFEWDVARDRFTWPGLTELGDDGQPRPLTRNREGAFAAIHPDDREEVERTVDATFQQPRADGFSAEYRAALPGGPYTRRLLTGRILRDATGRPTRVVGVSTDVTEQRACQDRMRQGEKMEALGRVASGISHDFNNVLLMMMGHAELAAGRLAEGDRARHHVEEVLRAGQAAADLTKQILAFSRRQELKPRVVDLGEGCG